MSEEDFAGGENVWELAGGILEVECLGRECQLLTSYTVSQLS